MTNPQDDPRDPRTLELELEVPGTPEQVWEAIATGQGVTAWMIPAEIDEREGGACSYDMGSGMQQTGVVTGWEPPRRFAQEESWTPSGGGPEATIATEWLVETRAGGTCLVRMVMSGFGTGAAWDQEIEGMGAGMRTAFENLGLYLTHFPGRPCATIMVSGNAPGSKDEAWSALTGGLGLSATEGAPAEATAPGAPALAGVVERAVPGDRVMLRTHVPAPGLATVSVYHYRDIAHTSVHLFLYGDEGAAGAAREEPAWQAWMESHFPKTEAAVEAG